MKLKCKSYFPRNNYWCGTSHYDVVKHADEMSKLALKVRRAWKRYHLFILDNDFKRAAYVKCNIGGAVQVLLEAIRDFNLITYSPHWDRDTNLAALEASIKITQSISLPIGWLSTDL